MCIQNMSLSRNMHKLFRFLFKVHNLWIQASVFCHAMQNDCFLGFERIDLSIWSQDDCVFRNWIKGPIVIVLVIIPNGSPLVWMAGLSGVPFLPHSCNFFVSFWKKRITSYDSALFRGTNKRRNLSGDKTSLMGMTHCDPSKAISMAMLLDSWFLCCCSIFFHL